MTTKCTWTGCESTKDLKAIGLAIVRQLEGDKLEPVNGQHLPTTFCPYHFLIAGSGHVQAKLIGGEQGVEHYELQAPFPLISLVETILTARELTRQAQLSLDEVRRKNATRKGKMPTMPRTDHDQG